MRYEIQTRMLDHCPTCRENVQPVIKHDTETGQVVAFCPICGTELSRASLSQRGTAADQHRPG